MGKDRRTQRLETEAIVVGYAMSRLDGEYLRYRNARTWRQVFAEAARALSVPASSIKNLRDEFDPFHCNRRRGWYQRPLRTDRLRVLEDLKDVSDEALMALIDRIIVRDEESIVEAVDSMTGMSRTAHNVAERLLTGRKAEDYFLTHSESLIGIKPSDLTDRRLSACGYDFGVIYRPELAIEVKGLKLTRGEVLFTDREWTEARTRRDHYWLVVIGNLSATPQGRLLPDPAQLLQAICSYQVAVTAIWRSKVSVTA